MRLLKFIFSNLIVTWFEKKLTPLSDVKRPFKMIAHNSTKKRLLWGFLFSLLAQLIFTQAYCENISMENSTPMDIKKDTKKQIITYDFVKTVKEKHTDSLMQIKGVVGVGIGRKKNANRDFCLRIYVSSTKNIPLQETDKIPIEIDGVPVEMVETGEIRFSDGK